MTVIPASPELPMQGAKQHLTVRILECTGGGFLLVYEGHKMAARSTWDEVLDSVNEIGSEVLKVQRLVMPRHMERDRWDGPPLEEKASTRDTIKMFAEHAKEKARATANIVGMVLAAVWSAALTLISVKIA